MAGFCTAHSFPFPLPSQRVVMVTFDSAVDEGAYLNDLTLPSSSPVKNRGIFCERKRGRAEARAGEMDLRFGQESQGKDGKDEERRGRINQALGAGVISCNPKLNR